MKYILGFLAVLTLSSQVYALPFSKGSVPLSLSQIESLAEASFDSALAKRFGRVKADSIVIAHLWSYYREQAYKKGVAIAEISAMDKVIANFADDTKKVRDPVLLARSANAISAHIDKFYFAYPTKVPTGVLRLDYLGREILLDGMTGDMALATLELADLAVTWHVLKPAVLKVRGSTQAAEMEAIEALLIQGIASHDGASIVLQSKRLLDLVDKIEKLF